MRTENAVRRFAAVVTLAAFLGIIASPASASAGSYAFDTCQHPDGAYAGSSGWSGTYTGYYVYFADNCSSGGGLDAYWASDVTHAFDDNASWKVASPPGTTIQGITALRSAQASAGQPYGTPATFINLAGSYLESCGAMWNCSSLSGPVDFAANTGGLLQFGVQCGGSPGGSCPAGQTSISMRRIRVTLGDDSAPTFNALPTGTLMSPSSTARTRSLSYSAADVGGGLYRHRLLVDGREVLTAPVDTNGGKCVRYPVGNGFSSPTPCSTSASASLSYDTAGLSDGHHDLSLELYDATDTNKVATNWSVQVDNLPPALGEVSVDGVAREGDSLRCASTVDGQSPTVGYQWQRAAADGSNARDIVGASAATYLIAADDVGKKLLCRVTASDAGGAASRTSSVTAGPFASGGLVAERVAAPTAVVKEPVKEIAGAAGAAGEAGAAGANGAAGIGGALGTIGTPASLLPPLPTCTSSTLRMATTTTQITRTYSQSAVTLSGRLVATVAQTGVGGAALDVMQTVTQAGTSKRTRVVTVKTEPDGSFRVTVPSGPTRVLQLVDGGCGAVGAPMSEKVRGTVQARTTTRRVRNKQTARFSGQVLGGYVGRGLPLELQVQVGSAWKDVKAVTTDAKGRYRVSYRFQRTFVRYTYRFRVVTRAGSAWPYVAGRSTQVKVRVN